MVHRCFVCVYEQELTAEYNEKKQSYDTVAAGLESNMAKLEGEVSQHEVLYEVG